MSKRQFIRTNRQQIDEAIRASGYRGTLNDSDREVWIANLECLYRWALVSGVKV